MTDEINEPSESERPRPSRRAVLGVAAGTTAAAVAGLAGGVALASSSRPPAGTVIDGARRYADQVVMITGATSGIGRASALAFAREGAAVAFCGRREERRRQVADEITSAGGRALYVRADVRDEDQVRAFVDRTVERFGGINVALNNAGITIEKPLHEFTAAEFDDLVHTNLRGVFFAMKYQVPQLITQGGGTILVTASAAANRTSARRSIYAATKTGLIGLVRAAALDYGRQGIRIMAMLPGTTDTELVRNSAGMGNVPDAAWSVAAAQWARSNVDGLGRMAKPEEIAAFAVAVASSELTFLTGASLSVDGGTGAS